MNLKSYKKIETNRYELEIEVDAATFNAETEKIYQRKKSTFSVPGFRKGKAPKSFIEKYYGEGVFYEDTMKNLFSTAIKNALDELNLEFVEDVPDIEIVKASKTEGLLFKTKVTVMPEVEIENYKGIKVSKKSDDVTEEDVEKEIQNLLKKSGRLLTASADATTEQEDTVIINFDGDIDGEPFDGGKSENMTVELGKSAMIKGFEESIIGHKIGDTFETKLEVPQDYPAEKLAGKNIHFKITLQEIKKLELPEFNEEFVKNTSNFETIEEYKENLKKMLLDVKKIINAKEKEEEILEALQNLVKVDIPEALIKNKIKFLAEDFEKKLKKKGVQLKDYIEFSGMDMEKYFLSTATNHVKIDLALKKISELEKITVTADDMDNAYAKFSKIYPKLSLEKIKKIFPENFIKNDLLIGKTIDFVISNAIEE